MRRKSAARLERQIAELADRQHGVVARGQLRALGFSPRAIDGRLQQARLIAVHRAVYAVGHRLLTIEGRWMAAVLAGGDEARLTHRSAADLWGLTGLARPHADVTVPRRRRPRSGIRFHESSLPSDEKDVVAGIPTSTVARTLLDLATVTGAVRLEQAMSRAERRALADSPSLVELLNRYPRRRGSGTIRKIFDRQRLGSDIALSELEVRFLEFLDSRGLERPEVNAVVEVAGQRLMVDCLWRSARLVAELDSRTHHDQDRAFETDRARDLALAAAGMTAVRITWRLLHFDAAVLESELRAALARRAH